MSDSGDRQTTEGDVEEMSGADGGGDDAAGGNGDSPAEGDTAAAGESGEERPEPLEAADRDGVVSRAIEDGLVEPSAVEPDDQLAQSVGASSSERIAHALAVLGETLARVDTDRAEQRERTDDLESRLRRKQADFQNYKKRQKERMAEERERATEDLVERLLDVRDNLARALETDEDADIRGGIESTLAQFDRELDRENVDRIEPEPGDTVDPVRHEVLATVPSGESEDAIADIHRPGYEMAGRVLRPAQVTVSEGSAGGDDEDVAEADEHQGDDDSQDGIGTSSMTDEASGEDNGA
jgi:molecular chaperone GrpE